MCQNLGRREVGEITRYAVARRADEPFLQPRPLWCAGDEADRHGRLIEVVEFVGRRHLGVIG